jgi:hypothetical protein
LKRLLVEAVLAISAEPERSLKSIMLLEAIKVSPNITQRQLRILGAVFTIRYVNFLGAGTLKQLVDLYLDHIGRDVGSLQPTPGDLRHLEYCGCATFSAISRLTLYGILTHDYPGLLSAGYVVDDLASAFGDSGPPQGAIVACLRDPAKCQIAALNRSVLDRISANWSEEQKSVARQKLQGNLIPEQTLNDEIRNLGPDACTLIEIWDSPQGLSHVSLTSVGIGIGHCRVSAGREFSAVDIWL